MLGMIPVPRNLTTKNLSHKSFAKRVVHDAFDTKKQCLNFIFLLLKKVLSRLYVHEDMVYMCVCVCGGGALLAI